MHWLLEQVDRTGAQLVVDGAPDGVPALARRAWSEHADVEPTVLGFTLERTPDLVGSANIRAARRRHIDLVLATGPQLVLVFLHQGPGSARELAKEAHGRALPTWRWSARLGYPVGFGVDTSHGRYHRPAGLRPGGGSS